MIFNLDIIGSDRLPLNPSNITIDSELISLTDAITDSITVALEAGNNYTLVLPLDATAPTSTVTVSFPEQPALNFTTAVNALASGVSQALAPTVNITTINFSILSVAAETYDQTVTISGENIQITLTDGVTTWNFTGVNTVSQTIPNNSNVTITVASTGYHTYTNQITVYDEEATGSVLMQLVITDVNNVNYRRPYPNFFTITEPCTYNVHLYDGQAAPFGRIFYEENGVQFDAGNRNTVINTCMPDIVSLDQRMVVRAIQGCGGTSAIIWDIRYSDVAEANAFISVTVIEYKPSLTLNKSFDCCYNIGEPIDLYPASLDLNLRAGCTDSSLTYTITSPSLVETVEIYNHTDLTTYLNLDELFNTFVATAGSLIELGTYHLQVELSNCCATTTYEYDINICFSWSVTSEDGCNLVKLQNHSAIVGYNYTIQELRNEGSWVTVNINNLLREDILLPSSSAIEIQFENDGLYKITMTDSFTNIDRDYIFLLDCNIKQCKEKLLLDYLCNKETLDCESACVITTKWLKFKTLEDLIYHKWDEFKQQQTLTNIYSISNFVTDVMYLKNLINEILILCGECGPTSNCDSCN